MNKQKQNRKKTLEFVLTKQMEIFSLSPPKNLFEDGE